MSNLIRLFSDRRRRRVRPARVHDLPSSMPGSEHAHLLLPPKAY